MRKLLLILLLTGCTLGAEEKESKSRYDLLFSIFEKFVPESSLLVETGIAFDGTWGRIPLSRLAYWAAEMRPADQDEMQIARSYVKSKIPEVRIIASWAALDALGIKRNEYPDDVAPKWAGHEINTDEHEKFMLFFNKCLGDHRDSHLLKN
jgi:hypothetical protein